MNKWRSYLLAGVFLTSLLIRISAIWGYNFPFTYDQGRDMADLRHMVVTHQPKLTGPTTSINGVHLGPFWYYFLLPSFIVGAGDPMAIMIWQIIWYQISGLFLWWVLSKTSENLGLMTAILFLFMPVGFNINRYFWNANAMVMFTAFFFGTLFFFLQKQTKKRSIFLGIITGLCLQIEAAFGVLFLPFVLLTYLVKKEKLKNYLHLILGFLITIIPQLLFEIRHGFSMTKLLIVQLAGEGEVLGAKMTPLERLTERQSELTMRIIQLSHLHPTEIKTILLVSIVIGGLMIIKGIKKFPKQHYLVSLSFTLLSLLFYLIYPQKLKYWYILGLSVPLILLVSIFLSWLLEIKNKGIRVLAYLIVFLHVYFGLSAQLEYLKNLNPISDDPSNLRNQLETIDWVYMEAKGGAFKVYSFVPSIYDHNYHYLFWWYGTKTYGYQPSEVAYLPDQPEYIQDEGVLCS